MNLTTIIILLLIGLIGGVLSGFFGIGGGAITVPLLIAFMSYTQHQAQGTSLMVLSIPVTAFAAYNYFINAKTGQEIHLKYAAIIAVAFVLGGFLGSKIALNIDEVLMKRIFGVFLLIIAFKMIFTK